MSTVYCGPVLELRKLVKTTLAKYMTSRSQHVGTAILPFYGRGMIRLVPCS